ncbi:MAG TPA: ribose-phosphate diphosphokinase, partial [Fibrobacteria bacterium]|nr:ribose-phosphate diphosphokinase [Fibrobacteria bacterium]
RVWPDGELYQAVETPPQGKSVVLLAGTGTEADTLETFDLASALVHLGAARLIVVLAFFGYGTMEKSRNPHAVITAKWRARLWSALPVAPGGNRFLILEPHSACLPLYFEGASLACGMDGRPLLADILAGLPEAPDLLCSPDIGRIKWVEGLARAAGRNTAFVLKRRGPGGVEAFGAYGEMAGRHVVLCDDMIRTGKTLLAAAEACHRAGAKSVSAVAVHGAFAAGSLEALRSSGLFRTLACTDSHPAAGGHDPDWPRVHGCAGFLAGAIAGEMGEKCGKWMADAI